MQIRTSAFPKYPVAHAALLTPFMAGAVLAHDTVVAGSLADKVRVANDRFSEVAVAIAEGYSSLTRTPSAEISPSSSN